MAAGCRCEPFRSAVPRGRGTTAGPGVTLLAVTPEQRSLVLALAHGLNGPTITQEDFLQRWPAVDGRALGLDLLRNALVDRDADDLELSLILGSVFGFTLDYLPLLVAAAHADWHYRHEDVAQTLGAVGTEAALPALAVLVSARPSYADKIDDSVALARHALHGIERIGGAKARDLITDALGDEREPVRANAQRMLNRW